MTEALLRAGDFLADALRTGLAARGFAPDLSVRAEAGRVCVVSRSRDVWAAELGEAGCAPSAPVSGIAVAVGGDVAGVLQGHLREALR